ncbi:MAG: PEGA domain-containing protein [Candidatus Peregrinibacteria bacterium]|nr:PEGA domain-containing protein [Candidatus Peregrinibacteria bacterium]
MRLPIRTILISVYRILTVLAFVFSATIIVFMAFGYTYNPLDKKIEQTGIIVVNGSNTNLHVILDGQEIAKALPARILSVKEGYHSLEISKAGFLPFRLDVNVVNGSVRRVPFVLLVPNDPSKQFTPFADMAGVFQASAGKVSLVGASKESLVFKQGDLYWHVDPLTKKKTRIDVPKNMTELVFEPGLSRLYGFAGTVLRAFTLRNGKIQLDHEEEFPYTRTGLSFLQFTPNYQQFLFMLNSEIVSITRSENDKVDFITRFAQTVQKLAWFYDTNHFIVALPKQIQFCDESFTNCYAIHALVEGDSFALDAEGIYLFQQKEKVVQYFKLFSGESTFLSYIFSEQVSL